MITVGHAEAEQQRIRAALDARVTEPRVMSWHYEAPAVVLGRGQRPSPELLERAAGEGLEVVTRASGGGAVMAGPWMLSLTLLLPAAHALASASLPASYRAVGEACRHVLQRFRVTTELAPGAQTAGSAVENCPHTCGTMAPDELAWACFARASHGELLAAGGRKIVGVSQVRRRDSIAVCIGILLGRPDWEALLRVWQGREEPGLVREFEHRTASCDQLASPGGVTSIHSLAAALESELPALGLAA
jgi:lipoate---protein ligase